MGANVADLEIPGVVRDNSGFSVEVEDERFGPWLRGLLERFDVMFRQDETKIVIILDFKGGKFRQR